MSEVEFLRQAIEHLDDKAKADLKFALYGSGFFLALSFVPYGKLEYCSLIVAAIDLWYFMSWGNDQLRLIQHRDALKRLEGADGLEAAQERHPNYRIERGLYYSTSAVIFVFFVGGLVLDYHVIEHRVWRTLYLTGAVAAFLIIVGAFVRGFARHQA
jgi:hypothetical protein